MTFYQVLTEIQDIALSGVNECFIGDPWEVEATARKYPLCVLDANLKPHLYTNGMRKYKIDVYFVDVVKGDESNELNILSDMMEVGLAFLDYLKEQEIYYWSKGDVNFYSFTEKWDDKVSGIKIELEIIVEDDGNPCKNVFIKNKSK